MKAIPQHFHEHEDEPWLDEPIPEKHIDWTVVFIAYLLILLILIPYLLPLIPIKPTPSDAGFASVQLLWNT